MAKFIKVTCENDPNRIYHVNVDNIIKFFTTNDGHGYIDFSTTQSYCAVKVVETADEIAKLIGD